MGFALDWDVRCEDMCEELILKAKKEAAARGKEVFDYATFVKHYVHDTGSCERLTGDESKAVQDQYERMYYCDYPDFMTVIEFADYLNELDESY